MTRALPIVLTLALAVALAAGFGGSSCYSPQIQDCQYLCAPPAPGVEQCPDGFVCNVQLRCVSEVGMMCGAPIDGPPPEAVKFDAPPDSPGDGGAVVDGLTTPG
jgi:hypothetical protein